MNKHDDINYLITVVSGNKIVTFSTLLEIANELPNYLKYFNKSGDTLNQYHVDLHYYGWWIGDSISYNFSLYQFQSPEFVQGFISICNAFQVDF